MELLCPAWMHGSGQGDVILDFDNYKCDLDCFGCVCGFLPVLIAPLIVLMDDRKGVVSH